MRYAMHKCAARGCDRQVVVKMLMCRDHWRRVPKAIKDRVWAAYRTGQEHDPALRSGAYFEAVRDALDALDSKAAS